MPNLNNTNENGLVYQDRSDKYLDREALAYTEALQQGVLDDKTIHLYEFQHPENAQKIKESLGWNAMLNPESKKAALESVQKDIDEKANTLETQFTTEVSIHDKKRITELGGDIPNLEEQLRPQQQMISRIRKNSVGKMAAVFTALSLSASLSTNAQENSGINSSETTTQSTGSKEQAKKLTQEEFELATQNPRLFLEKSLFFEGSIHNEKIAEEIMKIVQQDPRLFLENAYRYVGFKSEGFDLGKIITDAVDNPKAFGKSYEENGRRIIRIGGVTPELFVIHLDSLKNVPNLDLGEILNKIFKSTPPGFMDYGVIFEHAKELEGFPNFDLVGLISREAVGGYYSGEFLKYFKVMKEIKGLDVSSVLNKIGEKNPQVFLSFSMDILKDVIQTPGFDLSKVILENPNETFHRGALERFKEEKIQLSPDVQKFEALIKDVPYFGEKSMYGLEALINNVVRHDMSTEEARKITQDPYTLYKNLVNIKGEPNHLADHDVSMYLSQLSTKKIQTINSLHNSPDNVRFKSLEKFNAKELYTLMVYGEDEVFTSSFNGIFSRLLTKMQQESISGDKLLEEVGQNKSRTFIKECAGYNRLDEFLATMDEQKQESLLVGVVQDIEKSSNPVLESVVVVDILGNLKNQPAVRKAIEDQIKIEYERTAKESEQDSIEGNSKKFDGSILYSVLGSVAASQSGRDDAWFKQMKEKYPVPIVDLREVKNQILFNESNKNIQEYFFYNDDDGKASFASFLAQYQNKPDWHIEKEKDFVKITGTQKGKTVEIYANYPETDEAGAEAVQSFLSQNNLVPTVVVHRGHSYHVNETIQDLNSTAKIVSLGSCGGYNNVEKVLRKSPDAHILSTKGVGTMLINDPLLKMLNTQILEGKDIEWSVFWEALGDRVGKDERFKSYVSPNKNAGAVFIKAYQDAVQKAAQNSQK
jgi:hypothetical protein